MTSSVIISSVRFVSLLFGGLFAGFLVTALVLEATLRSFNALAYIQVRQVELAHLDDLASATLIPTLIGTAFLVISGACTRRRAFWLTLAALVLLVTPHMLAVATSRHGRHSQSEAEGVACWICEDHLPPLVLHVTIYGRCICRVAGQQNRCTYDRGGALTGMPSIAHRRPTSVFDSLSAVWDPRWCWRSAPRAPDRAGGGAGMTTGLRRPARVRSGTARSARRAC
jgi:hypothetical protein